LLARNGRTLLGSFFASGDVGGSAIGRPSGLGKGRFSDLMYGWSAIMGKGCLSDLMYRLLRSSADQAAVTSVLATAHASLVLALLVLVISGLESGACACIAGAGNAGADWLIKD
jgi:hypothetical protein